MSYFLKSAGRVLRLTSTQFGTRNCSSLQKGLVLGVYSEEADGNNIQLSESAHKFNEKSGGKLLEHIKLCGNQVKEGKSFVFWGLDSTYQSVAVVGLGKRNKGFDQIERINQDKESVRRAATVGCKALQAVDVKDISVDSMGDAEAAAEGSVLSTWKFQEYKTKKDDLPKVRLHSNGENENGLWKKGSIKANGQNLARKLADTPGNLLTPTIFSESVQEIFKDLNVDVKVYDQAWAEEKKMFSFLSVTRGSVEPPKFVELTYNNGKKDQSPYVMVGKGVTFDAGGISLKPSASMDEMRADMGGAAAVVGALQAIASLKIEKNVKVLIPLVENLPSGSATKPGDVVTAMNGKSICVDNTDAEGRLILADALCYSGSFNPKWVLDIATLTGAMRVALGNAATGVFTNSNDLYRVLEEVGANTGDRVWQMPLWKHYSKQVTDYPAFDLNNVGKGKGGGSCTAAAFLKEFVPEKVDWLHLDIASVMGPGDDAPYISGMTGRPTRTLVEFIAAQE
ncbi:PREDICTED: cytosol aminopeptidase-like isoform X2 [Nicrophorus vespilloides]|uniref:Cytosol aminopeptidase n=1 Tax=Nicrophorus vespilloides TaxID=110193 RepID=A0ABM1MWA2_NICVS|nr:PREDICTED: cytosol aminopeptidase-like isoform X2 [Nicrophorus vespilloides]